MLRSLSTIVALLGFLIAPAAAEDAPHSDCLAMSNARPRATPVVFRQAAAATDEVTSGWKTEGMM